jgi:predicted nucleotidyltransferase
MVEPERIDVDEIGRKFPELELLVLHGSRAREEAHPSSDWDFAYSARDAFDELGLRAFLADRLRTDGIDLVDLGRAGGLLRYRAAREGKVVFERRAGEFERFALQALRFWLDAAPAIRAGYTHVLESVDR